MICSMDDDFIKQLNEEVISSANDFLQKYKTIIGQNKFNLLIKLKIPIKGLSWETIARIEYDIFIGKAFIPSLEELGLEIP